MRLEIDIPEHHYNNIMALDSVSLGRVPYKGIIMYSINAIKHGKVLEQEPTTNNDLGVDCIDRTRAIERLKLNFPISQGADNSRDRHRYMQTLADIQVIREMPSVTPQEPTIDKIYADIQKLRGCSCSCSDGIIDDVEDIIDKAIKEQN